MQLDREALDAELARLKQDADPRYHSNMPRCAPSQNQKSLSAKIAQPGLSLLLSRFYMDRDSPTSCTGGPVQPRTVDVAAWMEHEAR